MAQEVARGQIWMLRRPPPDKRRPVLVLSRDSLLRALHTATVAAITSTRRGSPTEVDLGAEDGLKQASAVNLANVYTVLQSDLNQYVGTISAERMDHVCRALAVALACDE